MKIKQLKRQQLFKKRSCGCPGLGIDAEAVRELVLIGLSNVDPLGSDNKPSNRELLESILFHVTKENKVSSSEKKMPCHDELDLL